MKTNLYYSTHTNRVNLVFSDMGQAFDYYMDYLANSSVPWVWAKVEGRVVSYVIE